MHCSITMGFAEIFTVIHTDSRSRCWAKPIQDAGSPKDGMVIDFSILKKVVQEQIISQLDHSLMINEKAPIDKLSQLGQMYERHQVVFVSANDRKPGCLHRR